MFASAVADDLGASPAEALAVELAGRPLLEAFGLVRHLLSGLVDQVDVDLLRMRDAAALVPVVDGLVRQATAVRSELVARAAEAGAVPTPSGRTKKPDLWGADVLGVPPRDVARDLRRSDKLRKAPATRTAFREGRISADQASRIAEATNLAPGAEGELLALAVDRPAALAERCREIKARHAGREGEERRHQRHRRNRRLIRSETADLAAQVTAVMPATWGARFDALLQPFHQHVVDQARRAGRQEPVDAHRLDALLLALRVAGTHPDLPWLASRSTATGTAGGQGDPQGTPAPPESGAPASSRREGAGVATDPPDGASPVQPNPPVPPRVAAEGPTHRPPAGPAPPGEGPDHLELPWDHDPGTGPGSGATARFGGYTTKVFVRVDWTALVRGHAEPGERCDLQVAGRPPVPVTLAQLRRILEHDDPLVAVVLHDGTDVAGLVHLGREPSGLQRSALEALHDRCADRVCGRFAHLEVDHLVPVEDGGATTLANLAPVCPGTHDAKTHGGAHIRRIPGSHQVESLPPGHPHHPRTPATVHVGTDDGHGP